MQLSGLGPPRESRCFTAISASFGYKNKNKTQFSVRYCHISAPISVRTSVALPKVAISLDDGAPMISAGLGALISGAGCGCAGARAVLVGVEEFVASGVEDAGTSSSTAQAAKIITIIRDNALCLSDLVVTSSVGFV